jgi:hypothetical protein
MEEIDKPFKFDLDNVMYLPVMDEYNAICSIIQSKLDGALYMGQHIKIDATMYKHEAVKKALINLEVACFHANLKVETTTKDGGFIFRIFRTYEDDSMALV